MNKKVAAAVLVRAAGRCERCGSPAQSPALHHRKLRSRGGKDELSNVVALHHACHNLTTGSVHLSPKKATTEGWLVSSWDDPATTPVLYWTGELVLLNLDGTSTTLEGVSNGK